jgi:carotenoid cleavage dioxygenase-like enzyme
MLFVKTDQRMQESKANHIIQSQSNVDENQIWKKNQVTQVRTQPNTGKVIMTSSSINDCMI